MVKCHRGQQEKMMDFHYHEEHLKRVYQTKYYYGSFKKSIFSFSSDLQIDRKISNVKEDARIKTDSNFDFSQVLRYLVFVSFNKKQRYVVHIIELFLHQKKLK